MAKPIGRGSLQHRISGIAVIAAQTFRSKSSWQNPPFDYRPFC
jgi:hypothetical protein